MTSATMLNLLKFKFRSHPDLANNETLMLEILNQAQDRVICYLNNHLLSELHEAETNKSLTNDAYDIGSLTGNPFGGVSGIQYVKIYDGKFCRKVSFREYQDHADSKMTFDLTSTVWYSRGTKIYPVPSTTGTTTIDIYYLDTPTAITSSATSELNAKFHDLIVETAESELWAGVSDFNKRNEAAQRVIEKIEMFNSEAPETDMIIENVDYDTTIVRDYVLTT